MSEQQEDFGYNVTPLVPTLQPLDKQNQPPSSFGETLQSLAPISEKDLRANYNTLQNIPLQQSQLPDGSGFGGSYQYELTALESVGNVAPSLAAQSELPQQSNFSPIINDVVHQQTNDFSPETQATVETTDNDQQNIDYNNETNLENNETGASNILNSEIVSTNNMTDISNNQILNQPIEENQHPEVLEPPVVLGQNLSSNKSVENETPNDENLTAQTSIDNQPAKITSECQPLQERDDELVQNTGEIQPSQGNDEDEENTWSISAIKQSRLFPTDQTIPVNPGTALPTPPPQSPSPTNDLSKENSEINSKKRRKRIVIDESDDDETEEIREEVQKSTDPDQPPSPASSEKSVDSIEALEQRVEELKSRERPGPRSKKTSTILLREIEARTLLQNAVVIPTKSKKKKHNKHKKNLKRVLDSDEEEQVAPTIKMDVSDIGLFDGDPPQELTSESILVSENLNMGNDFFKLEGISIDEVGVVVPFDNPILPEGEVQDDGEDNNESEDIIEILSEPEEDPKTKKAPSEPTPEPGIEKSIDNEENKQNGENTEAAKDQNETTDTTTEAINSEADTTKPIIKSEPIEPGTNTSSETAPVTIKQEKTDPPLVIKQEPCTQNEAENFLADALRSQFGCDEKSKAAKKASEPIDPSSTFWGRDSSSSEESVDEWQPTSYVKTYSSSKKSWKKSSNASSKMKKKKRGHDSDSDDYKRRKKPSAYVRSVNASSFMRTQTVPAPNALMPSRPIMPLVNQKPATIRVAVRSKEELKRKVKDRFFDRSRLVPNDIYFGDVQVPMHILHAYNSDAFDSSSDSDGYNRSNRANQSRHGYRQGSSSYHGHGNAKQPMVIKAVPIQAYGSSSTNNALIDTFKRYLRAAGIKKVNFARLWEGCHTSAERARAMLKLLRNKGLQGEPTLAKCRALKKKRKVEKEVKELDTSVILDDDEGIKTRRSTRQVEVKKEDVPVAVETLNKLKQVVDSESE